MQSTERAREALERLTAEQYEDPPPHRAVLLPRWIMDARVAVAESALRDVAMELETLESTEAERQQELSASAAELRHARDRHERARAADSAARARMAHIRTGALPHAAAVLEQLTNTGQ